MEKNIIKEDGSVFCNKGAWKAMNKIILDLNPSKIFIVTDTNTKGLCLPHFLEQLESSLQPLILTIPAGEENKTIHTCMTLWSELSQLRADRKSLVINLGGGVVTDLGGFVACTYQRGIEFINIPTSLLSMVDASVGGKNGVDLGALKNQIGIIKNPKTVIIDTAFLGTLPRAEFTSGMAEMIKHGFIHSQSYLERVSTMDISDTQEVAELVWESVIIKNNVITEDPREQGLRKTLNYGHTLGHAIESYFLKTANKTHLLHGEAIAIGMILATFISSEQLSFPKKKLEETTKLILNHFEKVVFTEADIEEIIKLLIFDKKNSNGQIHFVLLEDIGNYKLNCTVPNELIYKSFNFYKNFHC